MPISIFVGLVFCNLIWSFHPILGKWMLEECSPPQVACLRYLTAFLSFFLFALFKMAVCSRGGTSKQKLTWRDFFLIPRQGGDAASLVALGVLAYAFSPLSQILGLKQSLATENSLIIAMEPLITAGFAWLFLGERLSQLTGGAFCLALIGFCLLSEVTFSDVVKGVDAHTWGNFLILISLMGEASFTVLGKKLTQKHPPIAIFGSSLFVGVAVLTGAVFCIEGTEFFQFQAISTKTLFAVLWLGPLGTAATYLFAMKALAEVSALSMALLLFLQPVMGALAGHLIMGDRMLGIQQVGAVAILLALLVALLAPSLMPFLSLRKKRAALRDSA